MALGNAIGSAGTSPYSRGRRSVVARSAYLEQVRRIAPPDPPGLMGRDAEVAELARFCLAPGGASYAWWRAGPWAGKSALLSTFVLRPPPEVAEQVRIVSFFITARLAAQDTREAFTQVLLEQLAELLGQPLPGVLPEATREAYLLGLLSQAAKQCQDAGGRLLLVVDGLDEDRGVSTGQDAHSIAGLLPADPPAGMRVIVTGRPDPPVPDDVPDRHPLRDPAIIRPLPGSPHARDVQRLGRQELQRLLHGSTAEQDLLGLLAGARGGLSGPDLAELASVPLWEVEDVLRTVAGRTFGSRPSLSSLGKRPEVYLLGHEELQAAAEEYLRGRLAGYRDRLHAWAVGYRARKWPPGTPEYLLGGYFRLLEDLGDLPRMTECALDAARHDRMRDLTGGDAAALAEARTVLDRIAAEDDPDLASALALACHRDHLADRNAHIPESLPAVWAALGQLPRAEALARSMTSTDSQARALAEIATTLAQAGQHEQAEALARSITARTSRRAPWRDRAGAGPGRAAPAGRAVARSITDKGSQASALAQVAAALAQTGHKQRAEAMARSDHRPRSAGARPGRDRGELAQAGQHQHPTRQAEAVASLHHRPWSAGARPGRDRGGAGPGRAAPAAGLAAQAEAVASSITDPVSQAQRPGRDRGGAGPGRTAPADCRHRRTGQGRRPLHHQRLPGACPGRDRGGAGPRPDSTSRPRPWPVPSPTRSRGRSALAEVAGALAQAGSAPAGRGCGPLHHRPGLAGARSGRGRRGAGPGRTAPAS